MLNIEDTCLIKRVNFAQLLGNIYTFSPCSFIPFNLIHRLHNFTHSLILYSFKLPVIIQTCNSLNNINHIKGLKTMPKHSKIDLDTATYTFALITPRRGIESEHVSVPFALKKNLLKRQAKRWCGLSGQAGSWVQSDDRLEFHPAMLTSRLLIVRGRKELEELSGL